MPVRFRPAGNILEAEMITHKQICRWFKDGKTMHGIASVIDKQTIPNLQTIWRVERIIRAKLNKQKGR